MNERRATMSKARGAVLFMIAAAVLLLGVGEAMAGGGVFPTYPGDVGFALNTSTGITALIVLDPNGPVTTGPPATSTGGMGAIAITSGKNTVTGVFQVEPNSSLGELRFGCNLLLTNQRFVEFAPGFPGLPLGGPGGNFFNWLPPSVTLKLFGELGMNLTSPTLTIPGVAGVISQQCIPFPKDRKDVALTLFQDMTDAFHVKGSLLPHPIKPLQLSYPDRTISGASDDQQWFPGILVLQVNIGLWQQP
jgi:hypothetical protein